MKKFIGIMMAMIMGLNSTLMNIRAEDNIGTVEAEFYSNDNNYKTRELSYSITIEDNGNVNFVIDKFTDSENGKFCCPNLYIKDSNNILYTNSHYLDHGYLIELSGNILDSWGNENMYEYKKDYTYEPNITVYTDTQGKLFYKKNNEKIYFTDTIIVEFNGITITKEIGNDNSETQIIDSNPVYGDFNSDGEVDAADAVIILQYAAERGAGSFTGTFEEYVV